MNQPNTDPNPTSTHHLHPVFMALLLSHGSHLLPM